MLCHYFLDAERILIMLSEISTTSLITQYRTCLRREGIKHGLMKMLTLKLKIEKKKIFFNR